MLLSAFAAHINFQPSSAAAPAGYAVDTGAVYGDQADGLSYGWNGSKPAQVFEKHGTRKLSDGVDSRYDTFALLRSRGRGSSWEIAVPNGDYQVHAVAGDPRTTAGRYRLAAEGVMLIDGRATRASRWIDGSATIMVGDGKLTLTAPRGITDHLDFIDITQVVQSTGGTPPDQTPPPGQTPPPDQTPPPTQPPPVTFPSTLSWHAVAPAPLGLAEAQAIGASGKLYVFGGYNVTTPNYLATMRSDAYDPATNTWTRIADMPQPLTHMGVATDGRYIYIGGGYLTDFRTSYQTFGVTNVWRYDTQANVWSAMPSLPAPRAAGAMVLLGNELHFFDGVDPARASHTDHWTLDLTNPSAMWQTSTPLPFSRNHMDGVVLNGKIYAIGGQPGTDDSNPSRDVLVWDPADPSHWTAAASLPDARSHATAAVFEGRIVLFGGTVVNDAPIASVIAYDPATNTWSSLNDLPGPRLAPSGGLVGSQIIITGGYDRGLRIETWIADVTLA